MRVLLDTHVLLWWLVGDARLSEARRTEIGREGTRVFVSAASGWEIATKHRLGKLPVAERLVLDLPQLVSEQGFEAMEVTLVHALRAGRLPGEHATPSIGCWRRNRCSRGSP